MLIKRAWTFSGLIGAAILMVLTLVGVGYLISVQEIGSEIGLPILAIAGLILLLATLSAMAMVFVWLDVANRDQALALPEGSIRSVIALSLIVLFGIFGFYLYGTMADSGKINKAEHLTADQAKRFADMLGVQFLIDAPETEQKAADGTAQTLHTIYFKGLTDQSSNEFAKQIMTVLGTLVTAISAFYFGAQTVQSATNSMKDSSTPDAPPKPKAVSPNSVAQGGDVALTITGNNLGSVNKVTFTSGLIEIVGTNLKPGDTSVSVSARFDPPHIGKWDVLVWANGKSVALVGALTVT